MSPKEVVVRGVDDLIADGNVAYLLTVAASTANGQSSTESVTVINDDNDHAGINVTLPATGLVVNETGTIFKHAFVSTSSNTVRLVCDILGLSHEHATRSVHLAPRLNSTAALEIAVTPATVEITPLRWIDSFPFRVTGA